MNEDEWELEYDFEGEEHWRNKVNGELRVVVTYLDWIDASVLDDKWFANIKWSPSCLDCHKKYKGKCHDIDCARMYYDEWGDAIPLILFGYSSSTPGQSRIKEYIEQKRKQLAQNTEND